MSEPTGTMQGPGVIRLRRRRGFWRDRLRTYLVRVDGNLVGEIAKGEAKDFFVPPGEHRVRLTIDRFWTSREIMLQLRAGELAEFICGPGGPAPVALFALLVPHRYISLKALAGLSPVNRVDSAVPGLGTAESSRDGA
jgi:hypothetical protein